MNKIRTDKPVVLIFHKIQRSRVILGDNIFDSSLFFLSVCHLNHPELGSIKNMVV